MDSDDRKRTFGEGGEGLETTEPKRMRPEEILGSQDDKKATTRLLMSQKEFSKVIGKGGQTIMHIRSTCGASVKGNDVDAENRLVILAGTARQVLAAFDMVSELMHQAYVNSIPNENFSIRLLLEHAKAGRVVGKQGANIQTIKFKSGAANVRMQKEPQEFSGVPLRELTIEGPLQAVRRAHFHVLEMFVDPSQMSGGTSMPPPSYGGNNNMSGSGGFDMNYSSMGMSSQGNGGFGGVGSNSGGSLPLPSLTTLGVQAETVRQLVDMKAYLSRQFGLDLSISREGSSSSGGQGQSHGGNQQSQGYTIHSSTPQHSGGGSNSSPGSGGGSRERSPDDVTFTIPRGSVGGIIGKGGQGLKDLQAEFGCRIYVEKDNGGQRTVVIKSSGGGVHSGLGPAERENLLRCEERILALSQAQEAQSAAAQQPALY